MANKLMVFDDDKDILAICTFILKQLDWEVCSSENCNDITFKVKQERPDLILMDNQIPDEGGITATKILKGNNELKHIPVIYFSASRNVESLAKQAGADAYLKKPFDLKEFENMVKRYTTTA
jgi:two-component system cell cycle response regulator DivK